MANHAVASPIVARRLEVPWPAATVFVLRVTETSAPQQAQTHLYASDGSSSISTTSSRPLALPHDSRVIAGLMAPVCGWGMPLTARCQLLASSGKVKTGDCARRPLGSGHTFAEGGFDQWRLGRPVPIQQRPPHEHFPDLGAGLGDFRGSRSLNRSIWARRSRAET